MREVMKALPVLALAASLLAPVVARADEPATSVGVDVGVGLPLGKLADGVNPAVGGLLRVEHRLAPVVDVTARLGALYFLPKDHGGISTSMLAIPLYVGVRVPLGEGPFLTGELGLLRLSAHASGTVAGVDASGSSDAEIKGSLLLGGGYRFGAFDVRATYGALDLGHFGDSQFVALWGGYRFAAF